MTRRRSLRWPLAGASRDARAHREDVPPPNLREAKNLLSQTSDDLLVLRPDMADRSPTVNGIYGGDYTEYPTLTLTNTSGDRLVVTNRTVLAYSESGSTYYDLPNSLDSVTVSNAANSTTITLSASNSAAVDWVGRMVRFAGETEYYEVIAATPTSLTVDRQITSAHSGEKLCVEAHWRGAATDWAVKHCAIGEIDLVMPEKIRGALGPDDLNSPIAVVPSPSFTSFVGDPEDSPEDYGQIGSRAPSNVSATAQAGGSLSAGTYYYQVAAKDALGRGDLSSEVNATADATNQTIQVSWDALGGVTTYYVWRGTASGNMTEYVEVSATSLTDDGTLSWTAAGPDTLEYRSDLTVNRIWGSMADSCMVALVEDSSDNLYIFRRIVGTDDDFHEAGFAGETVYAADAFGSGSPHVVVVVLTDSDVYVSADSGATFSATSFSGIIASDDVVSASPGYLLYVDVAAGEYYTYDVSASAWSSATSYSKLTSATIACGTWTNAHFLVAGAGCMYRLNIVGAFAGTQDVIYEDQSIPAPDVMWTGYVSGMTTGQSILTTWSSSDRIMRRFEAAGRSYTQDTDFLSRVVESGVFDSDLSCPSPDYDNSQWIRDLKCFSVDTSDGSLMRGLNNDVPTLVMPKPTNAGTDSVYRVDVVPSSAGSQYPDGDYRILWSVSESSGNYVLGAPKITTVYASGAGTAGRATVPQCGTFTVAGAYTLIGAVLEGGTLRGRRIRWSVPGTYSSFSGIGSGTADLPGDGRIVSLATVGTNVVVLEENRVGVLLGSQDVDAPWAYRPIAEGLSAISNPVTVIDTCYFVATDGLLYKTNGISTGPVDTGFDLTEFTDFNPDTPVWMTYSEDLHALVILVQDTTTLHVVSPQTGAWTTWTLPTITDGANTLTPKSVFQGRTENGVELVVGYDVKPSAPSTLVAGTYSFGSAPSGVDSVGGTDTHWYGMIETPAVAVGSPDQRVAVRGVTVETYSSSDPTKTHVGVMAASDDNDNWRGAGSTATVSLTTSTATGTAGTAAWSNKIAAGDDSTRVFTTPAPASKCRVYLEESGSYTEQTAGTDYTITDTKEITFTTAPTSSQSVYAWWDSEPHVLVSSGDLVLDADDSLHYIESVDDATTVSLDWYPSASTTGEHVVAREVPCGEGEVDIGVDVLCRRIQLRVYLYPEDDAGTSVTTALKALRVYLTGGGREEEDVE